MKKKLVLSAIILLMGSTLFITGNKKANKEITVEDLENNKSIAIYIKDENGNYNKAINIPTSGYTLNTTKSVCTNNARPSWNIKTNSLKISNLTNKDTGCYLYFDKLKGLALEMANAKPSPDSFTGIADTDEGMFYAEDDDGTTYYYRGAVTNNWFKFANLYWRIIRINGDGSIRMIYNGTSTKTSGEDTLIGTSKYSHKDAYYNSSTSTEYVQDNAYVGYMYGTAGASSYSETHANTNDSEIKNVVDNWYQDTLLTNYDKYISKEAGFCNDRSIASEDESWGSNDTKLGYGTNATVYGPFSRTTVFSGSNFNNTQKPKLKCTQVTKDLFTHIDSTKGNKILNYPVGLITIDEMIYAGGFGGTANSDYYLSVGKSYWTMSPAYVHIGGGIARVYPISVNGTIGTGNSAVVSYANGVRPVINISPDVKLIGDGTASNPYRIEGVE